MSPTSSNRRFNLLIAVVMGTAVMVAMVVVPASLNASSNTEAQLRSDEIAACGSTLNARVNDARSALDDANRAEARANNDVDRVSDRLTEVAIFDNDPALLAELRDDLDTARQKADAAEATADIANDAVARRTDEQLAASVLRQSDPNAFLDQCKEQP